MLGIGSNVYNIFQKWNRPLRTNVTQIYDKKMANWMSHIVSCIHVYMGLMEPHNMQTYDKWDIDT